MNFRITRPALLAMSLAACAAVFAFVTGVDLSAATDAAPGLLLANAGVVEFDAVMKKLADALDEWKTRQADELKAMRADVNRLDTKLSRPGAYSGSGLGGAASDVGDPGAGAAIRWEMDGKPVNVLRAPGEIRSHYAARADGGAELKVSDFMRAVANLGASPEARAVVSVGADADGGFAVPSRLMGEVLSALVPESAVMQAGAGILPLDMTGFGAKGFTLAAVDTTPQAAWRLENGAVAESSPGFRAVQMTPRSLSFFFKVSREWLADAVGVDMVLTTAIAQAFAKELDRAGLLGTGTAPEPRGVAATAGIIAVANGANGASLATQKFANFLSAVQQLLEANAPMPTAAIMSPRSRVVLSGLADSTGQPLLRPEMLNPVRMLTTSQVPNNLTVGTSTDCSQIYLGDWSRMVYAMRERMTIQKLSEAFATNGQVGFLCHVRADVAVMYPKAFAVVTGVRP